MGGERAGIAGLTLSLSLYHSITSSLPHFLTSSLPHSLTPPLSHSLTPSLPHSLTPPLTHSHTLRCRGGGCRRRRSQRRGSRPMSFSSSRRLSPSAPTSSPRPATASRSASKLSKTWTDLNRSSSSLFGGRLAGASNLAFEAAMRFIERRAGAAWWCADWSRWVPRS